MVISGTVADLTDLLNFFKFHARVTGIQRVQGEYIRRFIDEGRSIGFIKSNLGGFQSLPTERVRQIIAMTEEEGVTVDALRAAIEALERDGPPARFEPGATVVFLGAYWDIAAIQGFDNTRFVLQRLKTSGVRIGFYMYDLIPLLTPEFVDRSLTIRFTEAVVAALHHADFIMTISEAARRDVLALCADLGIERPVVAAPLGQELPARATDQDDAQTRAWLKQRGLDKPFVLCVCTLEVRKNHALLFYLWLRYARRGVETPKLVLVGRIGWRIGDLLAQIEATNNVGGRLALLHDLSDAQLGALYRACMFTVFPSLVEGWGLPVGESLAFGKPCVASNTSSIPEVGGDLVDYFNPWSMPEAEAAINRLMFDDVYRAEAEERIRTQFRRRSWDEAAAFFADQMEQFIAAGSPLSLADSSPLLPQDTLIPIGLGSVEMLDPAAIGLQRLGFVCLDGWYRIEDWGVWAAKRDAKIQFRIEGEPGPLSVRIEFQRSPIRPGHGVAAVGRKGALIAPLESGDTVIWFPVEADSEGLVNLTLRTIYDADVTPLKTDKRDFHLGLKTIGYVRGREVAGRVLKPLLPISTDGA